MMVGSADPVAEAASGDVVEAEALATAVGLEAPGAGAGAGAGLLAGDLSRSGVLDIDRITLAGTGKPLLDEVSLTVRAGEIVGVAGVSGNGQTELVSVLCGMTPASSGAVRVGGTDITRLDVTERLRAGLGRLTEDRRGSVVLNLSVEQNLVLEDLDRFRTGPFTSRRRMKEHVAGLMERFDIRAKPGDPIRSLSGGNMQKVLLARAISREPKALVASQPTRGLDVGACEYVYSQLRALRERGAGVLVISEDLDELLGLCDRIVVMVSGRIAGDVRAAETSREELGLLMTGMTAGAGAHS
jgi:simple sugar transport system ATP-binding protein